MFTLYDLIRIILPFIGILIGIGIAHEYGIRLGIPAIILGGFIGNWLGKLPTILMIKKERKHLAKLSVEELKEHLYNFKYPDPSGSSPNFLLLELKARGEDISKHIDCILNMMESESNVQRTFGYAALLSAFPMLTKKLKGYHPSKSFEECKQKIQDLRINIQNTKQI